ncbi:hypothetical protein [Acidisarcina polymorpha]|uniref:hypothetical protein n=1 Tax=Acidisarcina polymorpha TaxID=2211140 RepID=UPI000DEFBD7D|nr:hypothetical protein [Acidisarcina polymorpha]
MHPYAPIPAAKPNLSLNAFSAPSLSREDRNGNGERPSFPGALASEVRSVLGELPQPRSERVTSVQWESAVSYPAFCTVTASGLNRRPAARRRSALASPPFQGLGSSQNKFVNARQMRRTNFFRAPPRKHSLALGSRAHFAY